MDRLLPYGCITQEGHNKIFPCLVRPMTPSPHKQWSWCRSAEHLGRLTRSSRDAHLIHLLTSRKRDNNGEDNAAHTSPSYSVADCRRDCERERNASADGSAS
jgi:hypothetical protein